jgi:hypothetical protein
MKIKVCGVDRVMDTPDFYLLSDVARLLRCRPYRIAYLLSTRQVPEPSLRIGNKRVFTPNDISRIAEKLQIQRTQKLHEEDNYE